MCVCGDKHKALVTRSEQLAVSRLTHACNVSGTHLLYVLGDLVKTQPIAACTVISRSDTIQASSFLYTDNLVITDA